MFIEKPSIFDQNCVYLGRVYDFYEIPKEYKFLEAYFKTKVQSRFLSYYLCMGSYQCFAEHTGSIASRVFCFKMAKKCDWLLAAFRKAQSDMDLDVISSLHDKKYELPKNLYP
jgi:hypothetical protein